jgi:hypothetical protein
MFLDAPPLALFLLIPLIVAFPFALAVHRAAWSHRLVAAALAAATASIISVAIGVWLAGYGPTGASLAFGFTLTQYLPLCLVSVLLWVWLVRVLRSDR